MTILDTIKEYKLKEIEKDKKLVSVSRIEELAKAASPVRNFYAAIKHAQTDGYGLIAEIKKASPSKGLIREDFNPEKLATAYEEGGATCLSVLTDKPSFMGDKDFLTNARKSTQLPALRKDFMYDTYQVTEARALNADCILIIMASVSDRQAEELENAAVSWNMDVLIEVHNEIELERAMNLKSPMIGINNRDLKTFETSLETTKRLSKLPSLIKVGSWNSHGTPSWNVVTVIPIIWNPIIARNIPIPAPIPSFKLFGIELMIHALKGVIEAITNNTPATSTAPNASAGE